MSDYPLFLVHKGVEYTRTGKTGFDFKTDEPAMEYRAKVPCAKWGGEMELRLWRSEAGQVQED